MTAGGNPNHPVVLALETEWHKLAAILLCYFRGQERLRAGADGVLRPAEPSLEITSDMIEMWSSMYPGGAIVADQRGGKFVLRLVTAEEGEALARAEGGLPH